MRWLALFSLLLSLSAHAQETGLRDIFLAQVTQEAQANNIPPAIADAVAMVETGYRPGAVGSSGEIGIMQILPGTAAALGFRGSPTELFEPAINIHLAVQYLGRAWAQSGGDICKALTKYRAGLGTEITTPLSAQYCARAISWLMSGGNTQLAAAATMPQDAGPPPAAIDDPHVIRMVPIPAGTMPSVAPIVVTPQVIVPAGPLPRRMRAQIAAGQLSRFDSRVRDAVNRATSYDPDD
jgi:hypothetical protein